MVPAFETVVEGIVRDALALAEEDDKEGECLADLFIEHLNPNKVSDVGERYRSSSDIRL